MLSKSFWCLTPLGNNSYGRFSIGYDRKGSGAGLDVLEYEKLSFETLFKRTIHLKRFGTY
jgi:hypothetical protein